MLPRAERPWSDGNTVVARVHGATYFARLVEVVSAMGPGDRLCFTDWRGDGDERLTPDGPTVQELLCGAARRGVEVRGLLWRSHAESDALAAGENEALAACLNEAGGQALLDMRVRAGGSHHQKLVVARHPRHPERDVAWVGGIDLAHSRRDDARHLGDPQAVPMNDAYGPTPPWHDVAVEITGPAVADVSASFFERWNDPTPLDLPTPWRRLRHRRAQVPNPAPVLDDGPPSPPTGGHRVQVLRTYPHKRPEFPFAPGGERTVARGYERAFAQARTLVYLEDQYLWSAVVVDTLARALRRAPALQVVVVVPHLPDMDGPLSGTASRLGQQRAMDALRKAGGDRVGVYDLVNDAGTPVYVHAKVCVVDDTWLSCGSDNINRRSWTHDSELTVGVMDLDGDLPRDVRTALWSEHLGLPVDDPRLHDLAGAGALWRERAGHPGGRLRPHVPARVSRLQQVWALPLYRTVFDPDGRPLSLRVRREL